MASRVVFLVALLAAAASVQATKPYNEDLKGLCTKGGCDYTSGTFDYWTIPEFSACTNSPTSSSSPYCAAGSIHAKACCNKCSNTTGTTSFNCRYWVHIPSSPSETPKGGCSGKTCGKCILLPAIDGIEPVKGGGKKIRIGKACPVGKDDPHFLGAHGTRFEFNGLPDKTFCLYTDRQIHVNMGMRGYFDDRTEGAALIVKGKAVRTWIRTLAIMWRASDGSSHSFVIAARDGKEQARGDGFVKSIVADGKALPLLKVGQSLKIADLTLTFNKIEKVGPYDLDAYTVRVGDQMELDLRLRVAHPLLQTPDDAEAHINVMFTDVAPSTDVHGVMGQTYRSGREKRTMDFSRLAAVLHHPVSADGAEGKGFLDGEVSDYKTTSVIATDCRFSAFNTGELPSAI